MDVDRAVTNLNRTVLSDQTLNNFSQTLTNFGVTMSNVEAMTVVAGQAVQEAQDLVHSNTPSVNAAVTDLRSFSEKLNGLADALDRMVVTNRPAVNQTIQNLHDSSASIKQMTADLQAGHGLAGALLKDEEMKANLAALLRNANQMAAAFSTFGSNLNQRGIWSMLWKPKTPERRKEPAR